VVEPNGRGSFTALLIRDSDGARFVIGAEMEESDADEYPRAGLKPRGLSDELRDGLAILSRQCEARGRSAKMHSRASHICTIAVDWELSLASHTRLFGPGNSD
jgi:hypothetical protein